MDHQEKDKKKLSDSAKRNIGIVMICVSLALFVCSTFNFLYGVKAFLLGVFGIMLYALLLFMFLFGIALASGKKFVYSAKYLVYLGLAFFFFMCVLHIIFTGFKTESYSYSTYLQACFYSLWTPGGAFIGLFTFPFMSLLHDIAGIVIYGIGLIISIYFILSYLDDYREKKKDEKVERPTYETFHFDSQEVEYVKPEKQDEKIDTQIKEIKEEKQEEVIVKDEEALKQDRAKELLGLKKFDEEESLVVVKKESEEKVVFTEKKPQNATFSWQNRGFQDDKPQKFVYNESKPIKQPENPVIKENIEYLSTIHDINNVNDNPIINAEDYEDYKEKMKAYNDKQNSFLRRDDEDAKTIASYDSAFGFKHTQNDEKEDDLSSKESGFSPLNPQNFTLHNDNSFEIEPEKNGYDEVEEVDDLSPIVDLDNIQGESFDKKFSPLNPVNFSSYSPEQNSYEKREPVLSNDNSESSQKFMDSDYKGAQSSNVEESLGRSFNLNIINGTAGQEKTKEIVPDFSYPNRYIRPSIDLLKTYVNDSEEDMEKQRQNIEILETVLSEFKIPAKVEAVRRGAAVTRYELHMPVGIPVRKIHAHSSDIALALAAKSDIRIETPIKGKSAVGIEVPNDVVDTVGMKDIIASPRFMDSKAPLTFALGKDVDGNVYCCNLDKMPHLLVAGSTGSGKSVCLNALILSLMFKTSPEDLRLILVDPKRVEFSIYNDLPHLLMPKAITEPKKALNAFDWLIEEMERRFGIFQECFVKNLAEYNAQPEVLQGKMPKLPCLVLIVDELADLVVTTNKKELEERIIRLTQKARAAGIHLILATQRPSVDIITGSIKINLPSRIAFAVTNFVDSKTILDQGGAEKLLGRGDMLYKSRDGEPVRVQGCFVDTPEVKAVVDFIRENNPCHYDPNIEKVINSEGNSEGGGGYTGGNGSLPAVDSLMPDALKLVIENGQASISLLQRRFAIGYQRSAKIIDQMEMAGFISSSDGSKPRTVYVTMQDYNKIYGDNNA